MPNAKHWNRLPPTALYLPPYPRQQSLGPQQMLNSSTASHSSGAHYRAGRLLLVQSCLLQTLSSQHPLWISITSRYPSVNPTAAVITHMGNNACRVSQPMSQTWCLESKGVCYVLLHCLAPIMKDGTSPWQSLEETVFGKTSLRKEEPPLSARDRDPHALPHRIFGGCSAPFSTNFTYFSDLPYANSASCTKSSESGYRWLRIASASRRSRTIATCLSQRSRNEMGKELESHGHAIGAKSDHTLCTCASDEMR